MNGNTSITVASQTQMRLANTLDTVPNMVDLNTKSIPRIQFWLDVTFESRLMIQRRRGGWIAYDLSHVCRPPTKNLPAYNSETRKRTNVQKAYR